MLIGLLSANYVFTVNPELHIWARMPMYKRIADGWMLVIMPICNDDFAKGIC